MDLANEMSENWLTGDGFIAALDAFSKRHVSQSQGIHEAKCTLHEIVSEIGQLFRHLGICNYVEYTGSCYEGVHVPQDDGQAEIDFEAICVIDSHMVELEALAIANNPGYSSLRLLNGVITRLVTNASPRYSFFGFLTPGGTLDPTKMLDKFFEELQKCVNRSEILSKQLQVRRNGKSILLDVYKENGPPFWSPRIFTIDVIPAYEVKGELYVGTPLQEESMPDISAWRRLFSLREKSTLQCYTRNNQCNKQVLITLKAIRNREPGLAQLTSYHLKTVFFWRMLGSLQSSAEGTLSQNVVAVLRMLQDKLMHQDLPHFFLPEKNLFANMTSASIQNLRYTLNCFLTNKNKMMRVLTLWEQGRPFLEVLRNFLGPNKRRLDQRVNDCKDECIMYTSTIERLLRENFFSCRFLNTGCLFQGIGVRNSNETILVYEMLMIMSCHQDELKPYHIMRRPGQVYLEPRKGDIPSSRLNKSLSYYTFLSALNGDTFVDPLKTAENCFQAIKKCVEGSNALEGKVYIRRNGPFIRLSIYPSSGRFFWGRQLCSVDLIPSYEVGNAIYVARSVDGRKLPDWKAWRQSFALEEEQIWATDREGQCRKTVTCILLLLCMTDPVLSQLTSYHLKTALFKRQAESLDWSDEKLAERLMGVLETLYRCLKEQNLPDHFLPENNLLADLSPTSICEFHQRIYMLCTDEVQMTTLLRC